MKKKKVIIVVSIFLLIIIAVVLICYVLNRSNKLVCTSKAQDNFRKTETIFTIYYKKDKVRTVKEVVNHDFKSEEALAIYKEFLDESYNDLKDAKHINIKRDIKDLNYKITVNVKVNKLNNEQINSLELSKSLKELENILIQNNFSCE